MKLLAVLVALGIGIAVPAAAYDGPTKMGMSPTPSGNPDMMKNSKNSHGQQGHQGNNGQGHRDDGRRRVR